MRYLILNSLNYADQFLLSAQIVACILNEKDKFTATQVQLAQDLQKLMELEINAYARVGLPYERAYWESLQKKVKEILS